MARFVRRATAHVFFAALPVIAAACQTTTSAPAVTGTTVIAQAGDEKASKFPTHREAFSPANFRARRERLAKAIPDGVVVLVGAKGVIDAWEEHRYDPTYRVQAVRQEENFFYLTGLSLPGLALILDPKTGATRIYALRVTPA